MINPLDYIDPDEARPEALYAEALPCESCGAPTFLGRVWNAEHQIWVAQDCDCNAPSEPTCSLLLPALTQAQSVRQVCDVIRQHRKTCHLCRGVVEIRQGKEGRREPATTRREAA